MSCPKREAFCRLFPARVEKLMKALEVVEHCSKPHMDRNPDLTTRAFIEIAKRFEQVAEAFEINFKVTLDEQPMSYYDTSKPMDAQ